MNSASINLIALPDAGMPSVVVLAAAGVQPNQAAGFRVQIGMTVSCFDMRTKGGVCMPPQMPGAKNA